MNNPCRYCKKRTETCHAKCEDYKKWSEANAEFLRKIQAEQEKEHFAFLVGEKRRR